MRTIISTSLLFAMLASSSVIFGSEPFTGHSVDIENQRSWQKPSD